MPKVGIPFDVQRVLPLVPATVREQSAICWKTPVNPPLLAIQAVIQSALHLDVPTALDGSDNMRGADNQQERPRLRGSSTVFDPLRILRDHTPTYS